jgi:hypothetical protein
MGKKAQKIAEASDLRQKHSRRREASTPLWGKFGPPPTPTITPVPHPDRAAPQCPTFITDTGQASPLLAELMRAPAAAPPLMGGNPILEAGALACRRLKNGELSAATGRGGWIRP